MSTPTNNLGLGKFVDNEPNWGSGHRTNWDIIDALYTSGSGTPQGSVAGKRLQLYYDTATSDVYICTTTGTSVTAVWQLLGELTKDAIIGARNTWTKNQTLRWYETSAFGEGGNFTPDQDQGWIYIDVDAAITVNVPTGLDISLPGVDAQIYVIEFEQTSTPATISLDPTINFDVGLAPDASPFQLPVSAIAKLVLYFSPAQGGSWRGQWSVIG